MTLSLFLLLLGIIFVQNVSCDKTSEKIYVELGALNYNMCFRRMNGTHQMGCNSNRGGNVGVLHYVESANDVDWLVSKGEHKPYVVLMTPDTFTRDNVDKLRGKDGLISGILVEYTNITSVAPDAGYSSDSTCPNGQHDLYAENDDYKNCRQQEWNMGGNSMLFEDFDFPIAALNNYTDTQFLINECYRKFNIREPISYPLCAVEVKDAMSGAKDTPTCIRRTNLVQNLLPEKFCDPLGDYSLFAFSRVLNNSVPLEDHSVIMANTRMDGFSMFFGVYPSADSAVAGIVTLLAAAEALTKVNKQLENTKPIMYSLFNGEAFDYIGSSRVVYEMQKNRFPYDINPDKHRGPSKVELRHLNSFVEIGEVGIPDDSNTYYMHTDVLSRRNTSVNDQVEKMEQGLIDLLPDGLLLERTAQEKPLPPASAQSFLKKIPLPGVVIADHKEGFTNKNYNGRYDLPRFMGVEYPSDLNDTEKYDYPTIASERLTKVATLMARELFVLSTNDEAAAKDITADNKTVANLLYCLLISPQCELAREVLDKNNADTLAALPYPLYVSVLPDGSTKRNPITLLLKNMLAYFTGRKIEGETENSCKNLHSTHLYYNYVWMQGPIVNETTGKRQGLCIETTADYTEAKSPAFLIDDYDWDSKEYSSWTESRWDDAFRVRAFLIPSPDRELGTLLGGISMLVVSLVLVYGVNKRAALLFTTNDQSC